MEGGGAGRGRTQEGTSEGRTAGTVAGPACARGGEGGGGGRGEEEEVVLARYTEVVETEAVDVAGGGRWANWGRAGGGASRDRGQ